MSLKINLKNLTDEELLELLNDSQIAAFEELYYRYWEKLYASAYKRLQKEEISEEIVQDFFTALWINRQKLTIHTSFNNYTFRAIRNLVFKHYQKEYSLKAFQEQAKIQMPDSDYSTELLIDYHDLIRTLDREVDALPPKCRGVYNLSRKEYKSNKEIADILQISEKTVENHITKALKVLRFSVKNIGIFLVILTLFRTLS